MCQSSSTNSGEIGELNPSQPLRILHVTSVGKKAYGVATYVIDLAQAQIQAGHEVHFSTWIDRPFTHELQEMGHSVHPISVRAKYDPKAVRDLASIAHRLKIDVIHAHLSTSCIIAAFAGRNAKIPSFGHIHGLSSKWSFIFSTHVIASAEAARQHLLRQGMRPEKVSTAVNGLRPLEDFPSKSEAQTSLGIENCFPVLSSSCRIIKAKGIDDAIRAVALLRTDFPNIRYFACGGGDELEEMKALAIALGVEKHVVFPGYLGPAELKQTLAADDVFIFPSLKETVPMAILEAMSAGLPIIGSTAGGIPEIVDSSVGRLVPPSSPAELAAAISELANNSGLRVQLGAAAKTRQAADLTDVAMMNRVDAIYRTKL